MSHSTIRDLLETLTAKQISQILDDDHLFDVEHVGGSKYKYSTMGAKGGIRSHLVEVYSDGDEIEYKIIRH